MAPPAGLFTDLRVLPPSREADVAPNCPPFDAPFVMRVSDTAPIIDRHSGKSSVTKLDIDVNEPGPLERNSAKKISKVSLAGYTMIREISHSEDEDDDDDSDSDSDSDESVIGKRATMQALCAETLIDNAFASAMTKVVNQKSGSAPLSHVLFRSYCLSERSSPEISSEPASSLGTGSICTATAVPSRYPRLSETNGRKSRQSRRSKRRSSHDINTPQYESAGGVPDESIRAVFGPGAHAHLQSHHSALNRVVETIFGLDRASMEIKTKTFSEQRTLTRISLRHIEGTLRRKLKNMRQSIHVYVTSSPFTLFFMCLTLYVMFGPDFLLMLGNRDLEQPFLTLHTIILGCFSVEFILLACGVRNYLFSVGAALDLVAAFSLLNDTWILHNNSVEGSFVLHQSRITRLTRVARVARVTRLVPRTMALFRRRQKISLAKRFVMRRLRRAFLYLDIDQDGLISSFDLKCLYLTIIQGCKPMLRHANNDLLKSDAKILVRAAPNGNVLAENENNLTFRQFVRTFFATMLSSDVLNYHLRDMQSSNGVWMLTSSISDNVALKICVGLLVLIVMMKLVEHETTIPDVSPAQGLVHLYAQILHAKRSGLDVAGYLCQWVAEYQHDLKVLFLYMDGVAWVDYGDAACPSTFSGDPFGRIANIMTLEKLRNSDVVQACLPPFQDRSCPRDKNIAVALIDARDATWDDGFFSLLATVSVVVIIGILVVAFSHGINTFTHNTLNPTRALVDDMMAISSLELVHIDAEMPEDMAKEYKETPVQELSKLQKAFKEMRSAIRSWSSYVPPSVVERLFNAGVEATIGVSRTLATILFIDVEGFEDACDDMEPQDVNQFLATVFEKFAVVIGENRGTLLEFIGDEVLAVYNTPNSVRNHVYAGVKSALEIHRQIATLPKLVTKEGRTIQVRCRCGVHTAQILAGNIGSSRRMKYGLLGDGVNLTARMKNLNSKYNTQTVASQQVYDDPQTAKKIAFRVLDRVAVKGKTEPTTVYEALEFQRGYENSQKIKEAAQKHREAAEKYYQRNFVEARRLFSEVATALEPLKTRCRLSASELDQPSRQMKKKCTMFIKNPPGPDWDGVEHLAAKTFVIADQYDDDEDMFDHIVPSESKLRLGGLVSKASALVSAASLVEPLQCYDVVTEDKSRDGLEVVDTYPAVDISANNAAVCACSPSRCTTRNDCSVRFGSGELRANIAWILGGTNGHVSKRSDHSDAGGRRQRGEI